MNGNNKEYNNSWISTFKTHNSKFNTNINQSFSITQHDLADINSEHEKERLSKQMNESSICKDDTESLNSSIKNESSMTIVDKNGDKIKCDSDDDTMGDVMESMSYESSEKALPIMDTDRTLKTPTNSLNDENEICSNGDIIDEDNKVGTANSKQNEDKTLTPTMTTDRTLKTPTNSLNDENEFYSNGDIIEEECNAIIVGTVYSKPNEEKTLAPFELRKILSKMSTSMPINSNLNDDITDNDDDVIEDIIESVNIDDLNSKNDNYVTEEIKDENQLNLENTTNESDNNVEEIISEEICDNEQSKLFEDKNLIDSSNEEVNEPENKSNQLDSEEIINPYFENKQNTSNKEDNDYKNIPYPFNDDPNNSVQVPYPPNNDVTDSFCPMPYFVNTENKTDFDKTPYPDKIEIGQVPCLLDDSVQNNNTNTEYESLKLKPIGFEPIQVTIDNPNKTPNNIDSEQSNNLKSFWDSKSHKGSRPFDGSRPREDSVGGANQLSDASKLNDDSKSFDNSRPHKDLVGGITHNKDSNLIGGIKVQEDSKGNLKSSDKSKVKDNDLKSFWDSKPHKGSRPFDGSMLHEDSFGEINLQSGSKPHNDSKSFDSSKPHEDSKSVDGFRPLDPFGGISKQSGSKPHEDSKSFDGLRPFDSFGGLNQQSGSKPKDDSKSFYDSRQHEDSFGGINQQSGSKPREDPKSFDELRSRDSFGGINIQNGSSSIGGSKQYYDSNSLYGSKPYEDLNNKSQIRKDSRTSSKPQEDLSDFHDDSKSLVDINPHKNSFDVSKQQDDLKSYGNSKPYDDLFGGSKPQEDLYGETKPYGNSKYFVDSRLDEDSLRGTKPFKDSSSFGGQDLYSDPRSFIGSKQFDSSKPYDNKFLKKKEDLNEKHDSDYKDKLNQKSYKNDSSIDKYKFTSFQDPKISNNKSRKGISNNKMDLPLCNKCFKHHTLIDEYDIFGSVYSSPKVTRPKKVIINTNIKPIPTSIPSPKSSKYATQNITKLSSHHKDYSTTFDLTTNKSEIPIDHKDSLHEIMFKYMKDSKLNRAESSFLSTSIFDDDNHDNRKYIDLNEPLHIPYRQESSFMKQPPVYKQSIFDSDNETSTGNGSPRRPVQSNMNLNMKVYCRGKLIYSPY